MPLIEARQAVALLDPLTDLAIAAGAAILAVNRAAMSVCDKPDHSPVTEADHAADRVIAQGLGRLLPDVPVLSEERTHLASPPYDGSFVLVDPLDGTREFIEGRDEYTVNIAIVTDGRPLLGLVGAPAAGLLWRGVVGHGAERIAIAADGSRTGVPIHTRPAPLSGEAWTVTVSRSHGDRNTDAFITRLPAARRLGIGSALKFCRVAEGLADVYPRLGPTCEWDVAAGHAVIEAAGGRITTPEGAPLRFGAIRPDFIVPGFIAWGDPAAERQLAPALIR